MSAEFVDVVATKPTIAFTGYIDGDIDDRIRWDIFDMFDVRRCWFNVRYVERIIYIVVTISHESLFPVGFPPTSRTYYRMVFNCYYFIIVRQRTNGVIDMF